MCLLPSALIALGIPRSPASPTSSASLPAAAHLPPSESASFVSFCQQSRLSHRALRRLSVVRRSFIPFLVSFILSQFRPRLYINADLACFASLPYRYDLNSQHCHQTPTSMCHLTSPSPLPPSCCSLLTNLDAQAGPAITIIRRAAFHHQIPVLELPKLYWSHR